VAAKKQVRGPRVDPETVRRMERATGALGTAAIAAMDERLPWYRKMSAENRSWLGLVAQAGIAAFLDWIRHPERNRPAVTEVFGTAPRELARAVSLQHAVEMVRVIIDAVEGRSRSARPRFMHGQPRHVAPGTPGWKPWWWIPWCAGKPRTRCTRGLRR
jgi:hypothetical protein